MSKAPLAAAGGAAMAAACSAAAWPYSGAWAAAMDRIKAGLPPMIWDPVARRMVPIDTQGRHVENFLCGRRKLA